MVVISPAPVLSSDSLSLFYTTDESLSEAPILIFYGSSSNLSSSVASYSRLQAHVYTPAGIQSYQRLAISPSSPLYAAVNCLPREEQGDEVSRALAFSLFKYFSELSDVVKDAWIKQSFSPSRPSSTLHLFGDAHAAELASRMVKVDNARNIIKDLEHALAAQAISHIDVDIVLPPGSIALPHPSKENDEAAEEHNTRGVEERYGKYAALIASFGETAFIPTSTVHRAPSRPTSINRTTFLSKAQKETVRREMCELVDTEERYVQKLVELVHSVAADFRQQEKTDGLVTPTDRDPSILNTLFPSSLDQILDISTQFLDSIRSLLEETENAAIDDIEKSIEGSSNQYANVSTDMNDATGTLTFAKSLFDWFPKFADCYSEYIHAHSCFGQCLRTLISDTSSNYARLIQDIGEKRLLSMLIEPVQRLPRYSLYIDNIIRQLPVKHAAVKWLLRAKDVIAEICAQDSPSSQRSKILERLIDRIPTWPRDVCPQSRLIAALDVQELRPPYNPFNEPNASEFVLVLFADLVVLLRKSIQNAVSARGLLSDIENHSNTSTSTTRQPFDNVNGLEYSEHFLLKDVEFTEASNGCSVKVSPSAFNHLQQPQHQQHRGLQPVRPSRVFFLSGMYEGKASRFIREIAKARVESRYSEEERESPKWEARNIDNDGLSIGLFSAVLEQGHSYQMTGTPASTRIVIDEANGARSIAPGHEGVEILASVATMSNGFFRLEIDALDERRTRDLVTASEFFAVLNKRLGNLLQMRSQIRNPRATWQLLQYHEDILRSMNLAGPQIQEMFAKPRRAHSPVKALSHLLSGSSRQESARPPVPTKNTPIFSPPVPPKPAAESTFGSRRNDRSEQADIAKLSSTNAYHSLEKTMTNYILALHARKGNVVGRVIVNRTMADEIMVNELYNTLLEEPDNHERAAEAPVDVLFAAFEKFVKVAWTERMGRVFERRTLEELRVKAETLGPLDYQDFLLLKLQQSATQTECAMKAVIGVLADLLDGAGNDGDRGALTATFAQILVEERDSHEFMSTFDRLVEEHDVILGNNSPFDKTVREQPSISYAANAGSIGSKATSLGKKLGFGSLHREGSRQESSNKVSSVLRTWSKNGRSAESQSRSVALQRTKSVDRLANPILGTTQPPLQSIEGSGRNKPIPPSQPQTSSDFSKSVLLTAVPSAQSLTIESTAPVRKKRRSSLSDLGEVPAPTIPVQWMGASPKRPNGLPRPVMRPPPAPASSPITALPQKNALPNGASAPSRTTSVRITPADSKENTPPRQIQRPPHVRPTSTSGDMGPPTHFGRSTVGASAASYSPSGIPRHSNASSAQYTAPTRNILSERPTSGNTAPQPTITVKSLDNTHSPVKRKAVQTSQKLRERLETQRTAVSDTGATLQTELDKIGVELTALGPIRQPSNASPTGSPQRHQSTMLNLSTRLRALETKVSHLTTNLAQHTVSLEKDYGAALQASERRGKQLELQLRKSDDDNEALCRRSNEELERVFALVKGPQGVDELRRKLLESQEEALKYKRECVRLRRENAVLQSQLGVE